MINSSNILDVIKENIHNNKLEFHDQVKLFKYLGNDVLQVKTKQAYGRLNNKSNMAYKFAKGEWIRFPDVDLVTDCE